MIVVWSQNSACPLLTEPVKPVIVEGPVRQAGVVGLVGASADNELIFLSVSKRDQHVDHRAAFDLNDSAMKMPRQLGEGDICCGFSDRGDALDRGEITG